ncbi:MAG: glycosyl transferase [Gammaproteobacteria bacterium]|nr:MAG: glycosyl transferase [Gammaproteobacteria bacterium]RLA51395.1 MAG: glycosyl transferase [Gammaproteobacteria bacterium]
MTPKIAILGTVGIPASYGGFETLAQNLVHYHADHGVTAELTVYCSANAYPDRSPTYSSARLRYVPFDANGPQSIPYDVWSLFDAVRNGATTILLLGVSGALILPLIRLFSRARIVVNIDGIEWKREKWKGLAKCILRWSESAAVCWAHEVIADNPAVAEHVRANYGVDCHVIAYGGDHALAALPNSASELGLPKNFALALCRIEPENNVLMILDAFARKSDLPLIFIGNWDKSAFGRELKQRFASVSHLHLLEPIYDLGLLRTLREQALVYIHGHSAGGTNPSLVEMMHFGLPVLAYNCVFNSFTTEGKARYFNDSDELRRIVDSLSMPQMKAIGAEMFRIAQLRYTWAKIGQAYFDLLL